MRYTAEGLCRITACLTLGPWAEDLVYLPFEPTFQELTQGLESMNTGVSPMTALAVLAGLVCDGEDGNGALPLPAGIPDSVRRHLARLAAMGPGNDFMFSTPGIPYTHVSYQIRYDGMLEQVMKASNLWRLAGIGQLGFIHQPEASRLGMEAMASRFGHDRFMHSCHAAAIAGLILANHEGVLGRDECLHGLVGTLLHDLMTPAGGDTIKLLNRQAFDEDRNFGMLFMQDAWLTASRRYGLRNDRLLAIVDEIDEVGKIKDIADKIAYVCLDAWMMVTATRYVERDGSCPTYDAVHRHLEEHPFVGDVWECVRVVDGQVAFTDARRLAAFLKLRALMFRDLYHNPETRYPQFVYVECILRHLYKTGRLTARQLLTEHDNFIIRLMERELDVCWPEMLMSGLGTIAYRTFEYLDDAQSYAQACKDRGEIVLLEDLSRLITSGTTFPVLDDGGRARPLVDVCGAEAAEIIDVCRQACRITVYHIANPHAKLTRLITRNGH